MGPWWGDTNDDERQTPPGAGQAGGTAGRAADTPAVSPGSADEFDLYYVRTGHKSAHPL